MMVVAFWEEEVGVIEIEDDGILLYPRLFCCAKEIDYMVGVGRNENLVLVLWLNLDGKGSANVRGSAFVDCSLAAVVDICRSSHPLDSRFGAEAIEICASHGKAEASAPCQSPLTYSCCVDCGVDSFCPIDCHGSHGLIIRWLNQSCP